MVVAERSRSTATDSSIKNTCMYVFVRSGKRQQISCESAVGAMAGQGWAGERWTSRFLSPRFILSGIETGARQTLLLGPSRGMFEPLLVAIYLVFHKKSASAWSSTWNTSSFFPGSPSIYLLETHPAYTKMR